MMRETVWVLLLQSALVLGAEVPVNPAGAPEVAAYADGVSGRSLRLKGNEKPLSYPGDRLPATTGTVEFWFRSNPEARGLQPLLSRGNPEGGWVLAYFENEDDEQAAKAGVLMQRGTRPFTEEGEHYVNVSMPVEGAPGAWHHFAVSWMALGKGRSVLLCFLDGKPMEAFYDLTLTPKAGPGDLGIGFNSANLEGGGRFRGEIDELTIWSGPLQPAEIRKSFELVRDGKDRENGEGILLRLGFEGELDGIATATGGLSEDEVELVYEAVFGG